MGNNLPQQQYPDCESCEYDQPLSHLFQGFSNPLGLVDKSDREICAGQIIKWKNPDGASQPEFYVIRDVHNSKHTIHPVVELVSYTRAGANRDDVLKVPLDMLKELLRRANIERLTTMLLPRNLCNSN